MACDDFKIFWGIEQNKFDEQILNSDWKKYRVFGSENDEQIAI
jgi:hypothetical protein